MTQSATGVLFRKMAINTNSRKYTKIGAKRIKGVLTYAKQ